MALTINSCISEILSLPKSKGGSSVTSLRTLTEKLRMTKRQSLRFSMNEDMRSLWQANTVDYRLIDSISANEPNISLALRSLNKSCTDRAHSHVLCLPVQGALIMSLTASLMKSEMSRWCDVTSNFSKVLFKFARKGDYTTASHSN